MQFHTIIASLSPVHINHAQLHFYEFSIIIHLQFCITSNENNKKQNKIETFWGVVRGMVDETGANVFVVALHKKQVQYLCASTKLSMGWRLCRKFIPLNEDAVFSQFNLSVPNVGRKKRLVYFRLSWNSFLFISL